MEKLPPNTENIRYSYGSDMLRKKILDEINTFFLNQKYFNKDKEEFKIGLSYNGLTAVILMKPRSEIIKRNLIGVKYKHKQEPIEIGYIRILEEENQYRKWSLGVYGRENIERLTEITENAMKHVEKTVFRNEDKKIFLEVILQKEIA
jgi:hypothetical protein